jgi:hypothetical protein
VMSAMQWFLMLGADSKGGGAEILGPQSPCRASVWPASVYLAIFLRASMSNSTFSPS